jgi:hypothetical protein
VSYPPCLLIIARFVFRRQDVADRFEETPGIEPVLRQNSGGSNFLWMMQMPAMSLSDSCTVADSRTVSFGFRLV